MDKKKLIPVVVLLLAATAFAYYFLVYKPASSSGTVLLSGYVEATEVDLSFRLAGHVARILRAEGDHVEQGELLAQLDQTIYALRNNQAKAKVQEIEARKASLALAILIKEEVSAGDIKRAKAGVSAARARYKSLKSGSRVEEIRTAEAAFGRANAEFTKRQADFVRMKRLFETKIVPESQFEEARTGRETAKANLEAAKEQLSLVKAGPRIEQVEEGYALLSGSSASLDVARARQIEVERLKIDLKVIKAQLAQGLAAAELAENDLERTKIHAPFSGFIAVKSLEENEFVQPGSPIMTLIKLDTVWVQTFVPETLLGRVQLGQNADVKTDSFPDKSYPGKVTFISQQAEFTPKNVQTKEERVKLVYRIKISLDNPKKELKPGMPVDVFLR